MIKIFMNGTILPFTAISGPVPSTKPADLAAKYNTIKIIKFSFTVQVMVNFIPYLTHWYTSGKSRKNLNNLDLVCLLLAKHE